MLYQVIQNLNTYAGGLSDNWIADVDRSGDDYADSVELLASLTDLVPEGTGIYFGKDPHTMFVNIQHSAADGVATWALSKLRDHKEKHHKEQDENEDDSHRSKRGHRR